MPQRLSGPRCSGSSAKSAARSTRASTGVPRGGRPLSSPRITTKAPDGCTFVDALAEQGEAGHGGNGRRFVAAALSSVRSAFSSSALGVHHAAGGAPEADDCGRGDRVGIVLDERLDDLELLGVVLG